MSSVGGPPEPRTRRLANGLRVAVQVRPGTQAMAARLTLPLGAAHDPEHLPGVGALAWAWADRGAAGRDARAQADAWAALGARPGGWAGRDVSVRSVTATSDVLAPVLQLLADEAIRPTLHEDAFETARLQTRDELASLEDRPIARLDEALIRRAFHGPHGRSAYGSDAGLAAATPEAVRAAYAAGARPDGAVLSVAGGAEEAAVWAAVEEAFGGWTPGGREAGEPAGPAVSWAAPAGYDLVGGGGQVHLGWAWPLLPPGDPRAPAQALGMAVLALGSGSRLFREVREARGLAYAVEAGTHVTAGTGWASAYAATSVDRAGEAREVIGAELARLSQGVDAQELARARAGLATREALTAETAAGRAAQLARDVQTLGRARGVRERREALAAPDAGDVRAALAAAPARPPTHVALWPGEGSDAAGEREGEAA